ncbi:hypothetical protein GCM10009119_34610 [Algoriphagus jejuensis]|uniref:IPT/TIG domain-containing protein n=1 Tax=Algoriphagus jejuensis TaxID=419934 RepID=A0ABN1N486_9BACT
MLNSKTVFYLRSQNNELFDGAETGNSVSLLGKIAATTKENEFQVTRGFIDIGKIPGIENSASFTLEATIQPQKVTGSRQNILESQSPPVAIFLDDAGKLNGSVHTSKGWQVITSTSAMPQDKEVHVVFSREENGTNTLEANGKVVATKSMPGQLVPVGGMGFRVATGMDGRAFQFLGKVADIQIKRGVVNRASAKKRIDDCLKLEAVIKTKLGSKALVRVVSSWDESHARLLPIKNIMNAAGVEKLSDLDKLKIAVPTNITRGKVMVASKKSNRFVVDWDAIATGFGSLKEAEKKVQLAKFLPNRNSVQVLKAAADSATKPSTSPAANAPAKPTSSILLANRNFGTRLDNLTIAPRTGLRLPKAVIANSPTLATTRVSQPLNAVVDLDVKNLVVRNPEMLKNLASKQPQSWPILTTQAKMMSLTTLPVDQSVIIAGVLDLTNIRLSIEANVEKLIIIAEEIICGPNAEITWKKPGGSTPPRATDPGLNGRGWSGIHTNGNNRHGLDGENGRGGSSGITGSNGFNAPELEIWVKNLTNIPNINLSGEDGILGGKGQNGGRGGNGANGEGGKWAWFFGEHCVSDPGDGGDGGDGGRGGNGGKGGNGGNGAKITVGVLDGTLAQTVSANAFRLKNEGGRAGRGGAGGSGGQGGNGGRSGNGEVCKSARNGKSGAQGQPGAVGSDGSRNGIDALNEFFQFSEDAWDDLLTRPYITELNPVEVFPGNNITIRGTRFANNDRVILEGGITLVPTINADESISVTIPNNISGGKKSLFLRRAFDNTESNRLFIRVKPQLDNLPAVLAPMATIELTGKAFLNGATALVDGQAIPAEVLTPNRLRFVMLGTPGTGTSGGNVSIQVRNPDGLLSNARTAAKPRVLEIPFTYGVHNLPFDNFKDGVPTWGTFEDTFGAAEVWHELLDPVFGHPVLTGAFYIFYEHFLKGEDNGGLATGFCTSLASVVADKLWTGQTNAISTSKASIHTMLTAIHGKLLSRESLIHFHDQSREGVSRVERTARSIERTFMTGCDRENAPLLFFIPSGAIWDAGYIDGLSSSHCIMPYRFVYPEGHPGPQLSPGDFTTISSLDGVEMYCWDCNHADNTNCRLVFKLIEGVLHYDYFDGGDTVKFCSEENITLGVMSNGNYLLADHDLPFSGPFGLTSFILDFLLSPAELEITDENGLRVGTFNDKIFSEVPDSHPCYLVKGAYLLPLDRNYTRKIVGNGAGKYTYNSIMPDGTTIRVEDVNTAPGQIDTLIVNADASLIRFTPQIEKQFTMTFSRMVNNQVRSLSFSGIGGGPTAETDITISPDLSILRLGNRSTLKNVQVKAFTVSRSTNNPITTSSSIQLPQNHDLIVTVANWNNAQMNLSTLDF